MKIYFAGSIRGGREDKELYVDIIGLLRAYGPVLTEHVSDHKVTHMGDPGLTTDFIYKRDMEWMEQSDVVVAEVTTPSLGVGYELAKAEGAKPILCLYRPQENKSLSAMIAGNSNMKVKNYQNLSEVKVILEEFFKSL